MALNRRHGAAAVVVAVDDAAADVASGEEFVLYFFSVQQPCKFNFSFLLQKRLNYFLQTIGRLMTRK